MAEQLHRGDYWHKKDDTHIICDLCPRQCVLSKDQRGFCFVRQNIDDKMVLTTYGRSSGFCIDPIEKKPLHHFYPGTSVLSFGTAGCNLGCKFCQNWDISKSKEFDRLSELATPQMIVQNAKKLGCRSVAFTYNDPVIFAEYAIDVAKLARDADIKTVAVTAGYINKEARKDFFQYMDAANVDLKAFTQDFYKKLAMADRDNVLETLIYLKHETNVWFEITNLIIPRENDSDQEIDEMTKWISKELGNDVPLHFSAFHPAYKMKDHFATSPETLQRARQIAMDNGIYYVYAGNIHDQQSASTYCYSCGYKLIARDWYEIGEYNLLPDHTCPKCHTTCHGMLAEEPGRWGSRHMPVKIE